MRTRCTRPGPGSLHVASLWGLAAVLVGLAAACPAALKLPRPALVMYGYSDGQKALWSDALRHFNIITGQTAEPEFVEALRESKVLFAYHVTNTPTEGRTTAREFADYWCGPLEQTFAERLPGGFDAISIDEFHSAPDGSEESERTTQALRLVRERHPEKLILGWGVWRLADGGPSTTYGNPNVVYDRQLAAIRDCCDLFILECYIREGNPQLELLAQFARNLEQRCPGLLRKTIYGLYIPQSEPFIADDSPDCDLKGLLDEQCRLIRGDPVTRAMPGVGFWAFYRAHMDTLIWAGQLVEHYYRKGATGRLHPHGPGPLLRDGSFEAPGEDETGWQVEEAAAGTCARHAYADLGAVAPGHGAAKHGDRALVMHRQATGINEARQALTLRAGGWYAATAYAHGHRPAELAVRWARPDEQTELYCVENTDWGGWVRLGQAFRAPRDGKVVLALSDAACPEESVTVWDFVEVEWLPPGCRPLKAVAAIWDGFHVVCRGENLAPGCGAVIGANELEPAGWDGFEQSSWRARVGMTFREGRIDITWPLHCLLPYTSSCPVMLRF